MSKGVKRFSLYDFVDLVYTVFLGGSFGLKIEGMAFSVWYGIRDG